MPVIVLNVKQMCAIYDTLSKNLLKLMRLRLVFKLVYFVTLLWNRRHSSMFEVGQEIQQIHLL